MDSLNEFYEAFPAWQEFGLEENRIFLAQGMILAWYLYFSENIKISTLLNCTWK